MLRLVLWSVVVVSLWVPCLPLLAEEPVKDYWSERGCPAGDPRCEWFRDAKFGAIIHFGVYSELGGYYQGRGPYRPAEQIMGLGERRSVITPKDYLANVASKFNPTEFNADEWVKQMKAAGMKYVVFTTKHHDGFCMFDTDTTDFNVVKQTPFGRDMVKEIAEACRANDMHFCLYYSIGDWSAKEVMDKRFDNYTDYMKAQLKELLTNYGKVDVLWFDNWWYVDDQYSTDTEHARELYDFCRSLQPEMLVNDRCGAGVQADHGDFGTPENQLKGSLQERYFEVVMTCTDDDNWGWVRGAKNYREPGDIIRNIVDSASKGGNFVFNIAPNAKGEFPKPQQERLGEIGNWFKTNGEAVYNTTPAPEVKFLNSEQAYATKSADGKSMYLCVAEWPEGEPLKVQIEGEMAGPKVTLLADGKTMAGVKASRGSGALELEIARPKSVDEFVTVLKVTE
jgi:alpha-L-fucosidase